jgi:nitrite reductase/ring-hydroxylating ferredoxin subunit
MLKTANYVRAASLENVQAAGCMAVRVNGHTLALAAHNGTVYAVDNRCPHMGFPLHRGSVHDGILTCHWHHARFDLASGGTFDQFADDVPSFPVEIRDGEVWVDLTPRVDPREHQRKRLEDGLERNISLVIAKAVNTLLDGGVDPVEPFRAGLTFGVRYRQPGWGQGLTIHACMMNLLPALKPEDRARALYHGLSAVAADTDGMPPRFQISPLPGDTTDIETLKRWFRQLVEVRDAEGAERCIISAIHAGADDRQMADMLFAAVTDHRYITIGHVLDFTNKAFEALDTAGWEHAEGVLTSLVDAYARASRMEESNAWRHPIDLVAILEDAFTRLPDALDAGRDNQGKWTGRDELVTVLLDEDPQASADAMLSALRDGCTPLELAGTVAYAAALRIARFHTSNEFGDWDTALHTFTFANAVYEGLRRVNSVELLRGAFDAAMSVYLDRFLNVPPARLPQPGDTRDDPDLLLREFPALLDKQQQVDQVAELVARYLHSVAAADRLMAVIGGLLLREDRDFHTIQMIEAAFRQYGYLHGTDAGTHVLIAAARYLAAHAPTMRAQGQTYQIAHRLARGDNLFEEV